MDGVFSVGIGVVRFAEGERVRETVREKEAARARISRNILYYCYLMLHVMKRTRDRAGGPGNDGWGWVARGKHGKGLGRKRAT